MINDQEAFLLFLLLVQLGVYRKRTASIQSRFLKEFDYSTACSLGEPLRDVKVRRCIHNKVEVELMTVTKPKHLNHFKSDFNHFYVLLCSVLLDTARTVNTLMRPDNTEIHLFIYLFIHECIIYTTYPSGL